MTDLSGGETLRPPLPFALSQWMSGAKVYLRRVGPFKEVERLRHRFNQRSLVVPSIDYIISRGLCM
jgi:hypothetical protein